jgi:5-methylcytosine-specific restriction protein A
MPYAAPRICARCGAVVPAHTTCPCRPAWEGGARRPGRGDRRARSRLAKLKADPICQWVEPDGTRCRMAATEVDHITPLAESGDQWNWDNLQSLCGPHHQQKTTRDALRGKRRSRGA